jgi:putative transcriptional regulator
MAIKHHPDVSTLMSCSAGSQPEALAAVVSSHLSMCPDCAREVGRMALIGAALFEVMAPAEVVGAAPVLEARAREADAPPPADIPPAGRGIPYPLQVRLGLSSFDDIPWRRLAPGVWDYRLPLTEGVAGDLRLVKVAPGLKVPEHGHGGEELTLLLQGSYTDATGTYRTGDISDLDDSVEHAPVSDPAEGCICLVASERKARYKGLIARLLQPFTGL